MSIATGASLSPLRRTVLAAALLLAMQGCVSTGDGLYTIGRPEPGSEACAPNAAEVGTAVGVLVASHFAGSLGKTAIEKLAILAVGGGLGRVIGHELDRHRCEAWRLSRKYAVQVAFHDVTVPPGTLPPVAIADDVALPTIPASAASATPLPTAPPEERVGLSMAMRDASQFDSGQDRLTPQAQKFFQDLALGYVYDKRAAALKPDASDEDRAAVELLRVKRLLVVGHTDDVGGSRQNAALSERRALTVARLFAGQGVPAAQLFFQGAGETLPVADNRTAEGRAANRRVEIIDLSDEAAFHKFLALRHQSLEFYRPAEPASAPAPTLAAAPPAPAVAAPARPVAPPRGVPGVPRPAADAFLDFGGAPADAGSLSADIGPLTRPSPSFSVISAANAADPETLPPCSQDRPRVAGEVKSLGDLRGIALLDFMPGLYQTSWSDEVNGHLVGLSHVAVLRDGGSAVPPPTLVVWRSFDPAHHAPPDYAAQPAVNVYRGRKALLYRVFAPAGPLRCIDVLFPYDNSGRARPSTLFYDRRAQLWAAAFQPRIAAASSRP